MNQSIFDALPADGHCGCQLEEISVGAVSWAALQTSQCLPLYSQMGAPEIKNNSVTHFSIANSVLAVPVAAATGRGRYDLRPKFGVNSR
jgi:hypothetical protein